MAIKKEKPKWEMTVKSDSSIGAVKQVLNFIEQMRELDKDKAVALEGYGEVEMLNPYGIAIEVSDYRKVPSEVLDNLKSRAIIIKETNGITFTKDGEVQ